MVTISLTQVREVLKTPPVFPADQLRLQTNLDTDFLKLIAIVSMLMDHVGGALFPAVPAFRWAGRLAFPLFCYCMTVGLLYTRDVKKYLARLAVFALISQPFYILATHPWDWREEWSNMNIYFTLVVSLLGMVGVKTRKWQWFLISFVLLSLINFDYAANGLILMLIFYLCRSKPALGATLFLLSYLPALWNGDPADPRSIALGVVWVDWTAFAMLAAPLIFLRTHTGLKIHKYFVYIFYPAHLAAIGLARLALRI